jgi:hypothetical protein
MRRAAWMIDNVPVKLFQLAGTLEKEEVRGFAFLFIFIYL